MIVIIVILIGAGILAQEQITSSFDLLLSKQVNYGANGKTDELAAVLQETSSRCIRCCLV